MNRYNKNALYPKMHYYYIKNLFSKDNFKFWAKKKMK